MSRIHLDVELSDEGVDSALYTAVAFYQFSEGDGRYSEESMRDAYRAGVLAGQADAFPIRRDAASMPAEDIARVCHAANRALQMLTGDPAPSPSWSEAPAWLQAAEIRGVDAAQQGATPEGLHQLWTEHRVEDGWTHGPVKDPEAKTHPCLVPYDELPDGQRAKDALFRAIVRALS